MDTKIIPIRLRTPEEREKYWQAKAGRFAAIANWALLELLDCVPTDSNENDLANEHLETIIPYLMFDDEHGE